MEINLPTSATQSKVFETILPQHFINALFHKTIFIYVYYGIGPAGVWIEYVIVPAQFLSSVNLSALGLMEYLQQAANNNYESYSSNH